jgi:hypothetical protein
LALPNIRFYKNAFMVAMVSANAVNKRIDSETMTSKSAFSGVGCGMEELIIQFTGSLK